MSQTLNLVMENYELQNFCIDNLPVGPWAGIIEGNEKNIRKHNARLIYKSMFPNLLLHE